MNAPTHPTPVSYNRDAEMSVLGAMLLDKESIGTAQSVVQAEDFYDDNHRLIFEAIVNMDGRRIIADLVTLREELARHAQLERIGGQAYLIELMDVLPSAANIEHYARIVREHAIRRRLAAAADTIRLESFTSADPAADILDRAEASIFEIGEKEAGRGTEPVAAILEKTFEMIEARFENRGALTGLDTGFFDLNEVTAGLQAGDLIIVAARPSMGKTTFALNIALNACKAGDARVIVFSLEMGPEQLTQNLVCAVSDVDASRVRRGNLNDRDFQKLTDGANILQQFNLFIDATPGLTTSMIRTKARRIARRHERVDLIIVDYLQLVAPPPRSENRQQEISQISRALKQLARELNCPVMALSQLNRSVDSREDHTPRLSDLRESGAIEQDADVICFLYRKSYYDPKSEEDQPGKETDVIIAKQRNGPTGLVKLLFFPHLLRFRNPAQGGGSF
jgi:replicative DNA helicase